MSILNFQFLLAIECTVIFLAVVPGCHMPKANNNSIPPSRFLKVAQWENIERCKVRLSSGDTLSYEQQDKLETLKTIYIDVAESLMQGGKGVGSKEIDETMSMPIFVLSFLDGDNNPQRTLFVYSTLGQVHLVEHGILKQSYSYDDKVQAVLNDSYRQFLATDP